AVGCFFVMFIINSTLGLVSLGIVAAVYIYLAKRKNLETREGDTRSGMFNSLAEWSAKVVSRLPEASERAWQPNLLVPAQNVNDVVRSYKTIYNLARPKGSVKILGFDTAGESRKLAKRLPELCQAFMHQDISAAFAMVHAESYLSGVLTSMQSLKASFFRPNTLFLSLTDNAGADHETTILLNKAKEYGFGAYLYVAYGKVGLGLEKSINLWLDIRDVERDIKYRVDHINIGILTAYLLKRNWHAELNIMVIINDNGDRLREKHAAQQYMHKLMILARLPRSTNILYVTNHVYRITEDMPRADLNILTLVPDQIDIAEVRQKSALFETSILCTLDSGLENALA
ncbi:MAG: hypothetical protein R3330_17425, partial [Saprospiraceae bacterium]|nr:hypothetical protein [Saprospiraceae bacterium]